MSKYTAKPYVAGSPDAEVIGQVVLAFAENLEAEHIKPLLPKHGFENIDPEKWYPHQWWLNVLKDLTDSMGGGASSAFVAFGRKVVETAVMPPEINSIPTALNALHAIHHLNLRNIPDEEGYVVKPMGANFYHVYQNTPNPDDAIYGFLWGMVARFKGPGEIFVVRKIENPAPFDTPGTLFEIKWGNSNQRLD